MTKPTNQENIQNENGTNINVAIHVELNTQDKHMCP